ncbi:MAG: DNA polymerase II [Candidatus Woesearchaeota archaeon]
MEEEGYIVYTNSTFSEGKTYVNLFGRTKKGKTYHTKNEHSPYFFIKSSDTKKAKEVITLNIKETDFLDFEGNKVSTVSFNSNDDKKNVGAILKNNNIVLYEFDISCEEQFLNDNDIYSTIKISGISDSLGIINNPKLTPTNSDISLEIVSIDIETNRKLEIISISLYGEKIKKTIIVSDEKVKGAEIVPNEKELVLKTISLIKEADPDIITGWNVIDFDLHIIEERCKYYKIPFVLGRTDENCRLMLYEDFVKDSSANFNGRIVLDGISVVRINFVDVDDYKLDTVAKSILGEQKVEIIDDDKIDKRDVIENLYKNDKNKLAEYNFVDAKLVYDILQKDMLSLLIARSKITGMRIDKVKQSIKSLDSMYIKEAHKRGIVCYSMFSYNKEEPVVGAYVMTSKPGLYENLIVLDFKSLYPSIMRTYNIDPFALDKTGKANIVTANGVHFNKKEGILPELLRKLWVQRDETKKKKDTIGSYAFKVTMNSFYGALANPTCRFFSMDIANAITQTARATIKETISIIEKWDYNVIYSDTDSIFINTKCEDIEEAKKIGKKIEKDINKHFTNKIREEFDISSYIELQFDKTYSKFFMPSIRDSKEGAKKRYAGLLIDEKNKKIDITGLEYVRRDWTKLAKEFQYHLLEILFYEKDEKIIKKKITEYIKEYVIKLNNNEFDNLLVYRKTLTKGVEEYTKTTPPHVKAAMKMEKVNTNVIKYVMTTDGPEPILQIKHAIDYEHYIEKQLRPIANSILDLYSMNFDDVISKSKQNTLFGY